MTKSIIEIEQCNCEQSLLLKKQLFESNLMIKKLNSNVDPVRSGAGGLYMNSDGTATLYQVGIAIYRDVMEKPLQYRDANTELREKSTGFTSGILDEINRLEKMQDEPEDYQDRINALQWVIDKLLTPTNPEGE